jgi:hypothetical protein
MILTVSQILYLAFLSLRQIMTRWSWTCGILSHDSSDSIVKWMISAGLQIFLFATAPNPALGPTQPPIKWVPRALSPVIRQPKRDADHSPPSSAEVKNAWSYTSTPPIRLHGVVLS